MKICSLGTILTLCVGLTACGPNEYYVLVNNQSGNAQPLSKTSDIIKVILPHIYPNNIEKARGGDKDWLRYDSAARYELSAKQYKEHRLQALGYHVVDTGLKSKNDSYPNVIALIDAAEDPSKTHNVVRTWTEPSYTDTMGNPTAWDTKAEVYTMKHIDYKITLVRPNGKNNSLLKCITDNNFSTGFCISPERPDSYEVIFTGAGSMSTDANSPPYILNHITTAVWHDYPNMMGQNKVFLYSQPQPQVIRVELNIPKKDRNTI